MKLFACKEADLDCDFEVRDETMEGVVRKAMEHIATVHPDVKVRILDVLPPEKIDAIMQGWVKDS